MKIEINDDNFFEHFHEVGNNKVKFTPMKTNALYIIDCNKISYIGDNTRIDFHDLNVSVSFKETDKKVNIKISSVGLHGNMSINIMDFSRVNSNTSNLQAVTIGEEHFLEDGGYIYNSIDEYIINFKKSNMYQMLKNKVQKNLSLFV